jgi:hypothetical protein
LEAAIAAVADDPHGWARRAACKPYPKDVFFPPKGNTGPAQAAIAICAGCPVRVRCLAANINEQFGIWGGTTMRARQALRVILSARRRTAA